MSVEQKQPENLHSQQEEARTNPWNQGNVRLHQPGVNWMRKEPPGIPHYPPIGLSRHAMGDNYHR